MKISKFRMTRKSQKIALLGVAILTLCAAALMIFSEKNLHDTITDIIVLLVGSIALVMAVLTEVELEKHSRKFTEIHREMLEALREIRDVNADNEFLKKKLSEEFKIDQEISKKLDKIAKK